MEKFRRTRLLCVYLVLVILLLTVALWIIPVIAAVSSGARNGYKMAYFATPHLLWTKQQNFSTVIWRPSLEHDPTAFGRSSIGGIGPRNTNQTYFDLELEHSRRVWHLREACKKYGSEETGETFLTDKTIEENLFVAHDQKLLYCAVQKIGSSLWKRIFRILNGVAPTGSLFHQSGITSHVGNGAFTFTEKNVTWKNSTLARSLKFLFVRDPLERMFSAYMDKVFLPFGQSSVVTKRSSHDLVNATHACSLKLITFPEFMRTVLKSGNSSGLDPHFTPIHTHCRPCDIQFDIIGHLETLQTDSEYVLQKAGIHLSDVHADGDTLSFQASSDLSMLTDVTRRTLLSPAWQALQREECRPLQLDLLRRLWTLLQVRGLLPVHRSFPSVDLQVGGPSYHQVLLAVQRAYHPSYDNQLRQEQREEAMLEAYASVPDTDMQRVIAFHRPDCDLFGYPCSLASLQNSFQRQPSDKRFFKQWN